MKYADDVCVPERMRIFVVFIIFMREHHDVWVCASIDGVFVTAHVISCVVDSKDFVTVETVVDETDAVTLEVCECVLVAFVWPAQKACKEMVLELRHEVLIRIDVSDRAAHRQFGHYFECRIMAILAELLGDIFRITLRVRDVMVVFGRRKRQRFMVSESERCLP
jgi:hypothetical protein